MSVKKKKRRVTKRLGRPRSLSSVSDAARAPAIGVRLPIGILADIENWAAAAGKRRSDLIRELIEEAVTVRKATMTFDARLAGPIEREKK